MGNTSQSTGKLLAFSVVKDFQILWPDSIWKRGKDLYAYVVPLSVTLQLRKNPQDGWDQQEALAEFHELMAEVRLLPLRSLYASN